MTISCKTGVQWIAGFQIAKLRLRRISAAHAVSFLRVLGGVPSSRSLAISVCASNQVPRRIIGTSASHEDGIDRKGLELGIGMAASRQNGGNYDRFHVDRS